VSSDEALASDGTGVGVLIVDDQIPFRRAARAVFARLDGFAVVGEAASGEDAVALAAQLAPELVIMDINLPGISGIEATRQIVAARPHTAVILVSTYRSADLPADAVRSGAIAYVHKEDLATKLVRELWERRTTLHL
jgi:DNA-binding NarL/FixJ family response regulator